MVKATKASPNEAPSDVTAKPTILRRDILTQNARVTLIKDVLHHTEDPSYQDSVRAFGFDVKLFNKLLDGTHDEWIGKPTEMDFPQSHPVEHLIIYPYVTVPGGKKVEVDLVLPSEPSGMIVRLPKPPAESIGFEAVFLQEGSITYDISYGFDHAYAATGERFSAILQPGDLLLVPRNVARKVSGVTPGSKYLYIGDPWTDDDLPVGITGSA